MVNFECLHVSGLIPSKTRNDTMALFEHSSKAVITNARCLTEGVNIPAVDMVAFMDKKKSKIDIIQAIGRALRKSPGKEVGYIFLPLFIPVDKDKSIEEAIDRLEYDAIWDVVQSLSEQDESFKIAINDAFQINKRSNGNMAGLSKYISFNFEDNVNVDLQRLIKHKISVKIIDKIHDG